MHSFSALPIKNNCLYSVSDFNPQDIIRSEGWHHLGWIAFRNSNSQALLMEIKEIKEKVFDLWFVHSKMFRNCCSRDFWKSEKTKKAFRVLVLQ